MTFKDLRDLIRTESEDSDFVKANDNIQSKIYPLTKAKLIPLITDIGIIPEDIVHDSTEEKLFAKSADMVLSKCFQELGLNSSVNKERANCADVIARSEFHRYSLVADAKAFRLSRTAKNQKDFKVKSMIDWKGENDYSVLVCPYFQYPKSNSQIYGQALNGNVCLLGWEHFSFMVDNGIKETPSLNLSVIWNLSETLGKSITINHKDNNLNFHQTGNLLICDSLSLDRTKLEEKFSSCRTRIIERGEDEISFWQKKVEQIEEYSREKAIKELISALKINEKIVAIQRYIDSLRG